MEESIKNRISEKEHQIISDLSRGQIAQVKSLHLDNLNLKKSEIIGVRCEDIFYFLQCIRQGFISCLSGELMFKPSDFCVAVNPESDKIRSLPIQENIKSVSFKEAIVDTIEDYGGISAKQYIYRNIISMIDGQENFWKEMDRVLEAKFGRQYLEKDEDEDHECDMAMVKEIYFAEIVKEIKNINTIYIQTQSIPKTKFPLLWALNEKVQINLSDLLRTRERKGIIIGFNAKLLDNSKLDKEGCMNELSLFIEDGRVKLEAIVGFEALGDFEDKVLEMIKR
jgi:hypothetical protein